MITLCLVAAGLVLLFWPSPSTKAGATAYPSIPAAPPAPKRPSYLDAVSALQTVRHRLVETEQMGEPQQTAIDALTLALVRGSER